MTDNDLSKSIMSIARDIGVSEFLIKLEVHEDIRYFSYKIRKGQFLSQTMKDKKKDRTGKLLKKFKHTLQLNIFQYFTDEKNFCQDQMVN